MSEAQLKTLFAELGYPGILKFRAAAQKAGLDAPIKTLRRIVGEASQRQVLARDPPHLGTVVADTLHSRWAADLISYVAQPSADGFTHILVVQDIFSRMVWTKALKSAQTKETTAAFSEILREARDSTPHRGSGTTRVPFELNTDKGSEFTGKEFQDMLVAQRIKFKEKEGLNDIATLDRAIMTIKKTITKLEITEGAGDWSTVLQKATDAHNKNGHEHLAGGSPQDVEGDKEEQFELQGLAARSRDKQVVVSTKAREHLRANDSYRTVTTSALKGLKERSFKPRFEAGIQKLSEIEGRYAIDTQGKKTLVSRVQTVPATSTKVVYKGQTQQGDARLITTRREATTELRDRIAELMPTSGFPLQTITKILTPEEKILLKAQKLTTRQFLDLHEIFGIFAGNYYNKRKFKVPPAKVKKEPTDTIDIQ